jgi:2-polyprenyl-3-methyl-5-hydroxy-6-metoxy-1,4-benzoquinol methylase
LSSLMGLLRCLACGGRLRVEPEENQSSRGLHGLVEALCGQCRERYPITQGTVRMVGDRADADVRERTAKSFAYEWERFGELRPEWHRNFLDYLRPLSPRWLEGKRVLDVGTGSGRHARQAAELGAEVVAVDLGGAIDVARRNLPQKVLTVQADAEELPFAEGSFDLVMSIGVLHHLPDPAAALRSIARYARPGGLVHVYLYWQPPWRWHRALLKAVTGVRRVTLRMPHPLLHVLCYPLAAALLLAAVVPYRALRKRHRLRFLAEAMPLKAYADYPFAVLVNDQFDRLSAPIEHRYTDVEVRAMLLEAGLEDVRVVPNNGWVGSARRPDHGSEA